VRQMNRQLPRLETARLILTLPTPDFAVRLLAYVSENREHLEPWDPSHPPEYYTLPYWENALHRAVKRFESGDAVSFVLLDRLSPSGPVLGRCDFLNIVRGAFQACYLGYSLDHRAEGKGFMFEALQAAVRFMFDDLKLHRIMANYIPGNERSARLLERLGFQKEGYARDYLHLNGAWRDHVLNSLINPNSQP